MDIGGIIGYVIAGISVPISVWAILERKKAVHTANELRKQSRGDVTVFVKNAKVGYTIKNVWLRKANCPPEYLEHYEVSFYLSANSRLNVPTNIHDLELILEFSNGETRNMTEHLEARTHNKTVIEDPLTINVPENGAYSANYSATISKKELWPNLGRGAAPEIEAIRLKYMNDRNELKEIGIEFELTEPLSGEELQAYIDYKGPPPIVSR